jgi:hypothetical protein
MNSRFWPWVPAQICAPWPRLTIVPAIGPALRRRRLTRLDLAHEPHQFLDRVDLRAPECLRRCETEDDVV